MRLQQKQDLELIYSLHQNWSKGYIKVKKIGGQTNRNYLVQYKKEKKFIRIPWESDIVDRGVEAKNIFTLSRNKKVKQILPKYYLYIYQGKNILEPKSREIFNLPDGTMMAEYIPGKLFTISLFRKRKYQEELARMFYSFHTSGVRFVNRYNVFRDEIKKYRLAAQKYPIQQLINRVTLLKLKEIEEKAQQIPLLLKKGVSTHNDFIFQNFLIGKNGKIYLLDFEYAGLNQKGGILYDFGFLFADNLFRKPSIDQELFENFLEVADKIYKQTLERKQIYWLAVAAALVMFWWGLLRYFSVRSKKEKKYFRSYVLIRTQGIKYLYNFIREKFRA